MAMNLERSTKNAYWLWQVIKLGKSYTHTHTPRSMNILVSLFSLGLPGKLESFSHFSILTILWQYSLIISDICFRRVNFALYINSSKLRIWKEVHIFCCISNTGDKHHLDYYYFSCVLEHSNYLFSCRFYFSTLWLISENGPYFIHAFLRTHIYLALNR